MKGLIPTIESFCKRHGSTILTCVGAVGVVATTVSAVKATPKAMDIIEAAEKAKGEKLTKKEIIKIAAPAYIPTAVIGASTIACIFGANVLNKRQQASLASLYALADSSYKEYRAKVKEVLGEEADQQVIKAIALDKCEEEPIDTEERDDDIETFMDLYSMRLFTSTMERVMEAEEVLNDLLRSRGYVYVSDYYECLGIPCHDSSDYKAGWMYSAYDPQGGYDSIDFNYVTADDKYGRKCTVIDVTMPTSDRLF